MRDRELWLVRAGTVPYRRAWAWQRALVERRAAGDIRDTVLLLEHPHVYTIGKRGSDADVLADAAWLTANGAEVVRSDRGGQVTYHGPGQLVGYPITQLDPTPDIWRFVGRVEQALVDVAAAFGLDARGERGDLTGVWVGEAKLGAIGMRCVYVRSVNPGSAWPRYSDSALIDSPASRTTDAKKCRRACIPACRPRPMPASPSAGCHR